MADPNVVTAIKTELVNRMDELERNGDINISASIALGGIVEWLASYAYDLDAEHHSQLEAEVK